MNTSSWPNGPQDINPTTGRPYGYPGQAPQAGPMMPPGPPREVEPWTSPYSLVLSIILTCVGFMGVAGLHRFYVGKVGTGLLWLLTGGLFGVGTVVDLVLMATGSFRDAQGRTLRA